MGQFKDIDTILRQIADDTNVHPSIREAMRDATQPTAVQPTAVQPFAKVYLLMCDGVVTDVFTDKAMAMYDLHTCIKADEEEGLPHEWRVIVRQLNTNTLP
jgi:aconitase A